MAIELPLTLDALQLLPVVHKFPQKGTILYSKSGVGKTTAAATWPDPKIVQAWDPEDQMMPYYARVKAMKGTIYPPLNEPAQDFDFSAKHDASLVIPVRYGLDKSGRVILQVEDYTEADPEHPTSWIKWKARMVNFFAESRAWATIISDSCSQQAICYRNLEQFVIHPDYQDVRLWFGRATDEMERVWTQRFVGYKCNRLLLMHIKRVIVEKDNKGKPTGLSGKEEVEGQMVHMLNAPGRLASADGVPSQYSEVYRMYLGQDIDEATGERVRLLQTRKRKDPWPSKTHISAPDPCPPHYLALWSNYVAL